MLVEMLVGWNLKVRNATNLWFWKTSLLDMRMFYRLLRARNIFRVLCHVFLQWFFSCSTENLTMVFHIGDLDRTLSFYWMVLFYHCLFSLLIIFQRLGFKLIREVNCVIPFQIPLLKMFYYASFIGWRKVSGNNNCNNWYLFLHVFLLLPLTVSMCN